MRVLMRGVNMCVSEFFGGCTCVSGGLICVCVGVF